MSQHKENTLSMFDPALIKPAVADAFTKLSPRQQWRNPVMFVVFCGSILTSLALIPAAQGKEHD